MTDINRLITDNIGLWTSAIEKKSSSGRGASNKQNLIGIKKLRGLILELAINGRLVTNTSYKSDTDTSIKSLKSIKADLVKNKKIKKPKKLPEIAEEELNHNLPKSWGQMRLGDAINVLNGRAYKRHEMLQEGTPLLRVGNLFTSNEWYYSDMELEADKYIDNGDLIYAWSASFGPFIWEGGKVIYHYHIWKMDIFDHRALDKRFMLHYLAAISEAIKASGNGIAMIHMTKERMEKLVIPIPSLEEQLNIVEKIDELMALCDQLEQQTEASIDAHLLLVGELLSTLTISENSQEFEQNWTRISEHFDLLFTTEHSIEQLKQTILQLAVMGKLVPQNKEHLPASLLVKEITETKKRLIKDKSIKKQSFKFNFSEAKPNISLPPNWHWSSISELAEINPRNEAEDDSVASFIPMPLISTSHKGKHGQEPRAWNEIKKGYTHFSNGDLALAKITPCFENSKASVFSNLENGIGAGTTELHVARFLDKRINPFYTLLFIKTPLFLETGKKHMTGSAGQKRVPKDFFATYPMPLPPTEEQTLIVEKVDSLMSLCNQMKGLFNLACKTKVDLAEAIVKNVQN